MLHDKSRPAILERIMGMIPIAAFGGGLFQFPVWRSMISPAVFHHGIGDLIGIHQQTKLAEKREIEIGVIHAYLIRPVENRLDFVKVDGDIRAIGHILR